MRFGQDSFRLIVPTGPAAINDIDSTVLSSLKLFGQMGKMGKLVREFKRALQRDYESVHFIICDECSMVGCRPHNAINARC